MRKNALAALTIGLLLGMQAGAAPPASSAPKLEHRDYASARKTILGYGWKPLAGSCEAKGAGTCTRFPETSACSAVDPGFCGMVFTMKDRCLYIVTTGGEPGSEGADARVKSVSFRPGPCGKN